ncbi:hypothetical protein O7632_13285 [Solwaraspora sp. WMMD406]|uniref:hypothetical protein n=1 Tax=Solwaraspora sp. WMMD406 TaxID=3016095 RepID=UPI0024177E8B|nr:hypothetical protein [Solwaraspora sp. WMMD406]MDG4765064.1 hypothetical protein [Solwaraspora sp. WMMD406]
MPKGLDVDLSKLPDVIRELESLGQSAGAIAAQLRRVAALYPRPAGERGDEIGDQFEEQFRGTFNAAVEYLEMLAKGLDEDGKSVGTTSTSLWNSENAGQDLVNQFRKA